MFVVEHSDEAGWGRPAVKPFGPMLVHPASQARARVCVWFR